LDRHSRISRDKGKTNVHGKTNCPPIHGTEVTICTWQPQMLTSFVN
jgi:hypothetical protein